MNRFSKCLIIMIGCAFVIGCYRSSSDINVFSPPPSNHPIDRIVRERIKVLSNSEFQFELSSTSTYDGSDTLFDGHAIYSYSYLKRTNLKEVEIDYSHIMQKVVESYNDMPEVRPYLKRFPQSVKDITIVLRYGPNRSHMYVPPYYRQLVHIGNFEEIEITKGIVSIDVDKHQKNDTIEVKFNELPLPISILNPIVTRAKVGKIRPLIFSESIMDCGYSESTKAQYPSFNEVMKRYELHLSAVRNSALGKWTYRPISPGFWKQEKITLEQSRQLAASILEDLVIDLRKRKFGEKFLMDDARSSMYHLKSYREDLDWVCFRITFWDEWINRVEEPYIAQIQCQDGKFIFFTADEGQRLVQVHEEPVPKELYPQDS